MPTDLRRALEELAGEMEAVPLAACHREGDRPCSHIWAYKLRSLLASMEEPEVGWRPIETAPKDFTDVLVYEPWRGSNFLVANSGLVGPWVQNDDEATTCRPTHWMPLPAPPLPESETAESEET